MEFLNIDPIYHTVILGFVGVRKPKVLSWEGLSSVLECVLSSCNLGIRTSFFDESIDEVGFFFLRVLAW